MTLQFYFTLRQQFSLLITAKVHDNITNIFAVILDSYVYCCELHEGQQGDVVGSLKKFKTSTGASDLCKAPP